MVGVTSIEVKESREELQEKLRQTKNLKDKERLQVLYWLKQNKPLTIVKLPYPWANIVILCKPG
jgi:hypothetical protein